MESVEPILVVAVAKQDLRPLEVVPSEYLYLTSQVHIRVGQGELG